MESKYLHTSIQRSQKIIQCIALQDSQNPHEFCNVLLIYRNYAQVFNVDNSHQANVQVSTTATYPLFVPILWCCIVGEHIAAVTADAQLLMLESTPPFSRVSCHQLSTEFSPSTIPVAHCAASSSREFLVCCGFTENLILATFDSQDNPSLREIKLPEFYVYEVAPTQDPSIFAFLVSTKTGGKFLIYFDLYEFKEARRTKVPEDSITITSVFDEEGYSRLVIFTSDKIIIENTDLVYQVDSRVYSWFATPSGEIIVQLLNQSIIGIKVEEYSLIPRGSLPLISTFCHLSNNLLLCVSEENDSFFLPISSLPIKIQLVDFDLLPRTAIPLTPRITSAIFQDKSLIVLSGGCGDSNHYLLSAIYNTISFSSNLVDEAATSNFTKSDIEKDRKIRFFSAPNDCLIASTDTHSVNIKGNLAISSSPTIALGTFGTRVIQVHQKGLRLIGGKEYFSPSGCNVTAATIGDNLCIASFADGIVRLFNADLEVTVEKEIPNAHAFAFCESNIAIAAEPLEGGNSTVTLYSLDLIPTDDVGQLTSRAFDMLFQQRELYVSTLNGAVSRWMVGSDFSNSCAQIYQGESPPLLLSYAEFVLIVSNDTFLFNSCQLLSVDAPNLRAVCRVFDDKTAEFEQIYVLDDSRSIRKISLEVGEKDLTLSSLTLGEMPRKVVPFGNNRIACITRHFSNDNNAPKSSLLVVKPTLQSIEIQTTIDFQAFPRDGMISVEEISENEIALGFISPGQDFPLVVIKIIQDKIDMVFLDRLPSPTFCIKKTGKLIFVGVGPTLHYLRRISESEWKKAKADDDGNEEKIKNQFSLIPLDVTLPSFISFIEISNGIIWLADRIESVFAYRFAYDDKNDIVENLSLIAVDTSPRQITSMTIINESCIAVGEKKGTIAILRLPNDDIGNKDTKWRESPLPDRGISLDKPVGQLVKIATYSVSEAVTSLMVSSKGAIFYTTLLGQIGAFIPLDSDEDYLMLLNAEMVMERLGNEEFGLTVSRRFPTEKICVVSSDILDIFGHLSSAAQEKFETKTNCHLQSLFGLTCRIKQRAKF